MALVLEFLSLNDSFFFDPLQILDGVLDEDGARRFSWQLLQLVYVPLLDHMSCSDQKFYAFEYFLVVSVIIYFLVLSHAIIDDQIERVFTSFSFFVQLEVADVFQEADDD